MKKFLRNALVGTLALTTVAVTSVVTGSAILAFALGLLVCHLMMA